MNNANPSVYLRQSARLLLLAFFSVALLMIVWSVLRAPLLLTRDDNPRLVEEALRVQRGAIFDRNAVLLAHSTQNEVGQAVRHYPIANIGPAVGYYSFRHGAAGVEDGFNALLSGAGENSWDAFRRRLMHQPRQGKDVQLTLDAVYQQTADALTAQYNGALVLLQLPSAATPVGQILALVSHPGYDPNLLNTNFDTLVADSAAPLLNRAAQGQYQPGLALQPFILAAAAGRGLIELADEVTDPDDGVLINGQTRQCLTRPPEEATWRDVLLHRCPGPMRQLGADLGAERLDALFTSFGFTEVISLPLNTETAVSETVENPELAAIGQDTLTVTPLQMARLWAALTTNGRLPTLQLVTAVTDANGEWQPLSPSPAERASLFATAASRSVRQTLPANDAITEYSVLALAGPGGSTNAWYMGTVQKNGRYFVVVLILENVSDVTPAAEIGRRLLLNVTP